ncbi:hypothetical protein K505DRAFT_324492 [Melanomma pulvis-pyrius CBS 109.77]|uniref:Uncharacterized protein n=1 Tax=Melanomma pulvis-pyrius CBS 109.77 TaxID=1314802 RepID=A0A6A6XEA3_9PLEO|nr:hypothetical protein K505DRAFT_324492 [Melanomma pulvis-pyrius CBS 109.77]
MLKYTEPPYSTSNKPTSTTSIRPKHTQTHFINFIMEVGVYPSHRSTAAMPAPYSQQSVNPTPPPKYDEYTQPRNNPYTQQAYASRPQQDPSFHAVNSANPYPRQTYDPNPQPRYTANSTALQGYEYPSPAPQRYTPQSAPPRDHFPRDRSPQRRPEQGYYVSEGSGGGLLGIRGRRHERRRARRDGRQGRGFGVIGGLRELIAGGISNVRSGNGGSARAGGDVDGGRSRGYDHY